MDSIKHLARIEGLDREDTSPFVTEGLGAGQQALRGVAWAGANKVLLERQVFHAADPIVRFANLSD